MNPSDYIVGDGINRPRRNMRCVTCQNADDKDLTRKIVENHIDPVLKPMLLMMTFGVHHPKPVYESCKICNPKLPCHSPGNPLRMRSDILDGYMNDISTYTSIPLFRSQKESTELPLQRENYKLEHLVHFKGFSTCLKCKGRFNRYSSSNCSGDSSFNEIKILFGVGPNDFEYFLKFILEEFDQQMIRCCLLDKVISGEGIFRNFDPIALKCDWDASDALVMRDLKGQNLPMPTVDDSSGYDFSVRPSQQIRAIESIRGHLPDGRPNFIEITKEIETNHIESTENYSTNKQTTNKARKSMEREQEIQEQAQNQTDENAKTNSISKKMSAKPRKSNRSRNSKKKKNLKNSF